MFNFSNDFIDKLIKKDKSAFNEFYLKSIDIFFRYLKSNYFLSDSEIYDIISDFYLKIWNWIWKYNTNYNLNSWVWTVFKNTMKDYFKWSNFKLDEYASLWKDNDINDLVSQESESLNILQSDYEYSLINKEIKNLDDLSKEIIHLKYVEELSNKEISTILWISIDNVRQRASRAINKLKSKLK